MAFAKISVSWILKNFLVLFSGCSFQCFSCYLQKKWKFRVIVRVLIVSNCFIVLKNCFVLVRSIFNELEKGIGFVIRLKQKCQIDFNMIVFNITIKVGLTFRSDIPSKKFRDHCSFQLFEFNYENVECCAWIFQKLIYKIDFWRIIFWVSKSYTLLMILYWNFGDHQNS